MARKTASLESLPQLYKKRFKIGESMSIPENREAWREAGKRNSEKLKNLRR